MTYSINELRSGVRNSGHSSKERDSKSTTRRKQSSKGTNRQKGSEDSDYDDEDDNSQGEIDRSGVVSLMELVKNPHPQSILGGLSDRRNRDGKWVKTFLGEKLMPQLMAVFFDEKPADLYVSLRLTESHISAINFIESLEGSLKKNFDADKFSDLRGTDKAIILKKLTSDSVESVQEYMKKTVKSFGVRNPEILTFLQQFVKL